MEGGMSEVALSGKVVPDGAWSWFICLGNFIILICTAGIDRCFTVFYPEVMREFDVQYAQVSLAYGFYVGGLSVGGKFATLPFLNPKEKYFTSGTFHSISVFSGIEVNLCLTLRLLRHASHRRDQADLR